MAGKVVLRKLSDYKVLVQVSRDLKDRRWVQETMLRGIGVLALAQAQEAFAEQRLGDQAWPGRYPNQPDPPVNIAGILGDFLEGKSVPPTRRFERRKAGIDTGMLLRSLTPAKAIAFEGGKAAVVVGSSLPQAPSVQFGGKGKPMPVTPQVKTLLAAFLKTKRGAVKRFKKKQARQDQAMPVGVAQADAASKRLGFLFSKTSYTPNAVPRPYLGVTTQLQDNIVEYVIDKFRAHGGGAVEFRKT
jgi:phage gpG-like protein